MNERYKMIAAVYLIVIKDGKTPLLLRQNTGWMDGNYSLISGHVEKGETLTEAMVREAKEEAGIIVNSKDLNLVYVQHRPDITIPEEERLDFFFTTHEYKGEISNVEPHKCASIDWYRVTDLPKNITPNAKDALLNYQKHNYSELEWEQIR